MIKSKGVSEVKKLPTPTAAASSIFVNSALSRSDMKLEMLFKSMLEIFLRAVAF
jgi:hypothetical protein